MSSAIVDRRIATADPPPKGVPNPIHEAEGADGAGYAGALVAGVRTYGWAAETIQRAAGERWIASGWVDFSLRRPLFADEELTIAVISDTPEAGADGPTWRIEAVARGRGGDRLVLDGTAGTGTAPWFADLAPPEPTPGQDPPPVRPTYDLDTVPIGRPLRSLSVLVSPGAASRMATDDLEVENGRFGAGDRPSIHPYFVAGRMAPLTRHNFTHGPTIHVRSQIQHLAEVLSDQEVTVGATIVDAYDRNGHWYQVLDGVVTGSDQPGELARIRHHTIFRPRGTSMPTVETP
ncbi:MAG: hypothetical protein ACR2QK_25205 [Acidimicrobiales bacterium]